MQPTQMESGWNTGTEGAEKDRTHRYPRELTLEYSHVRLLKGLGGIIYRYERY